MNEISDWEKEYNILVPQMAKDPKKKRIEIHVEPELKECLLQLAKADKRSLLNYIQVVLEKHVKEQKKK